MKTIKISMVTAVTLLLIACMATGTWAASRVSSQKAKPHNMVNTNLTRSILKCSVGGTLKLDPNDHTNGYRHYKGKVTFTARQALKGVNLYLSGPKYSCTCINCPKNSSHATGLQPQGNFNANEKRTYTVDCPSYQQPLSGALGKGRIKHFIETSPPAGIFKNATCSGAFSFIN